MEIKHKKRSYSNNELIRSKVAEHVRYSSLGSNKTETKANDELISKNGVRTSPNSRTAKKGQQKPYVSRSIDTKIGMSSGSTLIFIFLRVPN